MTTLAVFAAAGVLDLLMPQPQVAEIRSGFAEREAPVTVRVGAVPGAPSETADEAYVLDVSPTGVTVTASTPQGERYARATLEQLKDLSDGRLPCCRVVDWPRLRWRGFMNDCGKNFLEVEGIKAILDVMAAYKMNLFHWHLTDYQGWRLESKKYPQLQKPESFTRQIGKFYTQDEFREVVAYAKERGITVMPELDVPGHTLAFRKAMGIDSMSAEGTDKVVAGLFEELCSLADEKTMPFIHLGTDEARLESEKCGAEWPNLWACAVNRCGRKAVVWAPGIRLAKDIDSMEMAWHDAYVTNAISPVIDASRMYHASWDPFDVLSHVAFTRPCRWTETRTPQLGAVTCCWHDDNMGDDTMKRFRECMMIPSIVGFAENYWTGRNEDRPEFIKRLPAPGTPAFAFAEALERRIIAQRDSVIAKRWPYLPFPFAGQTHMRWSVRDAESGRLLATDVPQATIWAYNERAKGNALIPEPCGGVVFETWVKSPDDRTAGCWIDCVKVHGEYGRDGVARMPDRGEWSAEGAEVLVNGETIAPPEWRQPGLSVKEKIDVLERDVPYMNDLLETPMVDELFTLRPPVPVQFKKGWNHIVVRLPKKAKRLRASTGMTFCPIEGTSEHPREVSDFEYSAAPPLHAFVQQWGDNIVRGQSFGKTFRDIPVSEGHFYRVKTNPEVDGACRFVDKCGKAIGQIRLSEQRAFYPPRGATAAELSLDGGAEVRFYEDPEPPKTPVPDPNAVPYEDRPQGQPTGRWQREIDVVAEKGGGTVRVPSGVWHVKPLRLRSNVTLELDEGAVLLASVDPLDYEQEPRRRAFVYAENATNVTIRGRGTLDGRGYVFRETGKNMDGASQPQALPKLMCFNRCRNVTLEDFTYRRGGAWGCHLCNCDGVTMRRVTCFNHVNNTNDGVDIESRNVLIEDCNVDADDDAIAIKSESDKSFAVTNIVIRNCRLASMAYPFKIGTGSYGDVCDVLVENCTFPRTKMNHRFAWSKLVAGITNDISGICGIGIQCVDGGRLENVTVRNIDIEGYGVPLAIRLGRRHQPEPGKATCLRNVLIENVKAVAEGPTASSIVGADGLEVENVTLRNVRIKLAGGATAADVGYVFPNESGYPGPNMFRSILPASGLYCRHVRDVKLDGMDFVLARHDERPLKVMPPSTACGISLLDKKVPRWLSVMPLNDGCADELASDAADLGSTTFIDGIAWSCPVNPEGDPVADRASIFAERYRSVAPKLQVLSNIQQGILLQATMGHGGFPGSVTPWQLATKRDGTSVYRMCPMDGRFLDYIAKTCRTFSDLKPGFFMIDDDTRLVWGDTPGCFCPLHLAEFSKRTGREWTREEVVAMLDSGNNPAMADKWEAVKADSLRRFFKTIRENFSPEIPGMLCVTASPCHLKHAREFAQILAAPGQTPVVRGNGAPYHGRDLFHIVSGRCSYAQQLELVGKDVVYLQESDTCPHTLWATSATRTYDHLVMLALEGCKGAKIWITRTGNYHEKKSAQAYRRIFRENRGLMEWAAKADFEKHGVVIPVCGPAELNFGDRYLALTGIPYRFGKARPGEVTAVTADTLKLMRDAEIREILSGAVIADGSAALWLSDNGYSEYTGVRAKAWNRNTIQVHEFEDGSRQFGMRTGGLVDLSDVAVDATILTRLLNRPTIDGVAVYEAPGSVLYANPRGGRVLSFAQSLPVQQPSYYDGTLFSESYKAEIVKWLSRLGGGLPGGVCYLGAGPVTCEAGKVGDDMVFVLNALDIDGDDAPEMEFDVMPSSVERLQADGTWRSVSCATAGRNVLRLNSPVAVQRPAIFRVHGTSGGNNGN